MSTRIPITDDAGTERGYIGWDEAHASIVVVFGSNPSASTALWLNENGPYMQDPAGVCTFGVGGGESQITGPFSLNGGQAIDGTAAISTMTELGDFLVAAKVIASHDL